MYIVESERVKEYYDGLVVSLNLLHREVQDRVQTERHRYEL